MLTLFLAEGGLWPVGVLTPTVDIGNETGGGYKALAINKFVQENRNRLWAREASERTSIKERMDSIFQHPSLLANLKKSQDTFWIIILGSWPAWGHEVMKAESQLVFFGDAIQYNKHGYKRIGKFIANYIMTKFPDFFASDSQMLKQSAGG